MRFFIQFSYNGTNYHGWQTQPNATSVQETLTKAMQTVFNQNITLTAAGRTDAGVHARQMFAHFDLEQLFDSSLMIHKLNSFLPIDIAVQNIFEVSANKHARFDAKKRTYKYYINTTKNPFSTQNSWYCKTQLDVEKMNQAAKLLLNHTNFECFSKTHTDVNTFNCTIFEANWKTKNSTLIFTISADRFLRNMVRAIVGTLIEIGSKKKTIQDFEEIIKSKNRSKAGISVPAHGLFLEKIEY
jgi:tRNA pseudouridine38-40 synthase